MPISIVVLSESKKASQLIENLKNAATPLARFNLIRPQNSSKSFINDKVHGDSLDFQINPNLINEVEIDTIPLLNPKLSRQLRQ